MQGNNLNNVVPPKQAKEANILLKTESYHSNSTKSANSVSTDLPFKNVIDLRSDTMTSPSEEMRRAIALAKVGDDVFMEDPTVLELESTAAKMLRKEAALYVPSGSMANLIACLVHCDARGSEIIVGDQAHIFYYEQGSISQFGGIHSYQVKTLEDGTFDLNEVRKKIRQDDIHFPTTKLICVENTHNRRGGRVLPMLWLQQLKKISDEFKVPLHLDGARIFNASVASGIPIHEVVAPFSSISVCLSKGLGAPVGSVLLGEKRFIAMAKRMRKALGGGMRQAGIIAAGGLYALKNNVTKLSQDHSNARNLATAINACGKDIKVEDVVETNIVLVRLKEPRAERFCSRLAEVTEKEVKDLQEEISVLCFPFGDSVVRLVTHLDIDDSMCEKACRKIAYVINNSDF